MIDATEHLKVIEAKQEGDSGEPVRPGVRPAPRTGYGQHAEMAGKEETERNYEGN